MDSPIKEVELLKAKNGQWTAKLQLSSDNKIFLHSAFSPKIEAKKWLTTIAIKKYTAYIVFGLGLGYYVKELLHNLPEHCIIIVIEPSPKDTFVNLIYKTIPNSFWLKDKRLFLISGLSLRDVSAFINKRLQEHGIKDLLFVKMFPLYSIYKAFYEKMIEALPSRVQQLMNIDYSFRIDVGAKLFRQAWTNINIILSAPGILSFKDKFKDIPAIMVAGGPSLDKNIDILLKVKDRFLIICAGSAVGALHSKGIVPNFLVMIDPHEHNLGEIEPFLNENTVLVVPYFVPPRLLQSHKGAVCFYRTVETHINANVLNGIKGVLPETEELLANVSVAVPAINFALYIGAKPVILLGQDLAFIAGKTHAAGSLANTYYNENELETYFDVEGWQGEHLLTNVALREVKSFLESWFMVLANKKTIVNASEGGVRIQGIEHCTLKNIASNLPKVMPNNLMIEQTLEDIFSLFNTKKNNCNVILNILKNAIIKIGEQQQKLYYLNETYVALGSAVISANKEVLQDNCVKIESVFNEMITDETFVLWQALFAVWLELFTLKKGCMMNYWEKYQQYRELGKQAEQVLQEAKTIFEAVYSMLSKDGVNNDQR